MLRNQILSGSLPKICPLLLVLAAAAAVFPQRCLDKTETDRLVLKIKDPAGAKLDKKLRRELLKMREKQTDLNQKILSKQNPDKDLLQKADELSNQNMLRLCEIFRERGWPGEDLVSADGFETVMFVIRNTRDIGLQREIFPVIVEAVAAGRVRKGDLAPLIDIIRTKAGATQIFGTQLKIIDEVAHLYPLENEANVDKWRKLYGLTPLRDYIKQIEVEYQTIVLKSPRQPQIRTVQTDTPENSPDQDKPALGLTEDEVISIDSRLVNLNVRVLNKDLREVRGLNLKKEDFVVFEDGIEQEVSFFSTADTPFDLVLLLDYSGSTREKQNLIADSAERFIELARPEDRIAVITFSDDARIISDFTTDKEKLFKKVGDIEDSGTSRIWDALAFTYDDLLRSQEKGKRTAIVLMTDGMDNTLLQYNVFLARSSPSEITFTDLLEKVRANDASVFSIYLDTENTYRGRVNLSKPFRQARRTLEMLSEETGGEYYQAKKLKDLRGIYEQIINDLSEVYSLGYEPQNTANDGVWRQLEIKIKNRPDLIVRGKRGYYAN